VVERVGRKSKGAKAVAVRSCHLFSGEKYYKASIFHSISIEYSI
jgi:hypothetical protein